MERMPKITAEWHLLLMRRSELEANLSLPKSLLFAALKYRNIVMKIYKNVFIFLLIAVNLRKHGFPFPCSAQQVVGFSWQKKSISVRIIQLPE